MANMTFSDEEIDDIVKFFEQQMAEERNRKAKIGEIYKTIFGDLSLTDKLKNFIVSDPWRKRIEDYFNLHTDEILELGIDNRYDLGEYVDTIFIDDLKANFDFIDFDFDKLNLSDEDALVWKNSRVFWFTTGLWLVTVDDTDYIVHKVSGQGETFYFIDTLDEFIVNDPNAKANLLADDLTKFAEQFKEFALKCKN